MPQVSRKYGSPRPNVPLVEAVVPDKSKRAKKAHGGHEENAAVKADAGDAAKVANAYEEIKKRKKFTPYIGEQMAEARPVDREEETLKFCKNVLQFGECYDPKCTRVAVLMPRKKPKDSNDAASKSGYVVLQGAAAVRTQRT